MKNRSKRITNRESNEWEAKRSKWKAALEKGMKIDLEGNENILYLGASTGSTISHIKDKTKGIIFAVEKAPKMVAELMKLSLKSINVAPILADAHDVEDIKKRLFGVKMNILFQDIPSTDQENILINTASLVDKDCKILLSFKVRSVSYSNPEAVLRKLELKLKEHFKIIQSTSLEPYHKDHYFYVLKKK